MTTAPTSAIETRVRPNAFTLCSVSARRVSKLERYLRGARGPRLQEGQGQLAGVLRRQVLVHEELHREPGEHQRVALAVGQRPEPDERDVVRVRDRGRGGGLLVVGHVARGLRGRSTACE